MIVCLDSERWKHIRVRHPEVEDPELVKATVADTDRAYPGTSAKPSLVHFRLGVDLQVRAVQVQWAGGGELAQRRDEGWTLGAALDPRAAGTPGA